MFDDSYNGECITCKGKIPRKEEVEIRHKLITETLRYLLTEPISCRKDECEEKKEKDIEYAVDKARGK